MTYPETVQYLEASVNYEKIPAYPYRESFKLERMREFLKGIGNPQSALRCLHIAGTKGKGSTCAFIAYILRQAGYKAGLYTSPHLSDFRERIRILVHQCTRAPVHQCTRAPEHQSTSAPVHQLNRDFEGMISKAALKTLVEKLRPAIEEYNKGSGYGQLSFFEVYTALAFVYFKEHKVDFAVLETGLGGRLDATNTVDSLVSVITPLSYEHTQKLGNTLREIAAEKAGIIKPRAERIGGQPVVISAPQEEEAAQVIRDKCRKAGARLYEAGRELAYRRTEGQTFSIKGIFAEYADLKIGLLGEHQLVNATVATAAVEALRFCGVDIGSGSIRKGLYNTAWPGRCEVILRHPLVVLDGAQNIASARVLKRAVRENFPYRRLILVFGVSQDKDIAGICGELYDLADEVILTEANSLRAAKARSLAQYFCGKPTHITAGITEAKALAYRIAAEQDLVLACGSLFLVGEFRNGQLRT